MEGKAPPDAPNRYLNAPGASPARTTSTTSVGNSKSSPTPVRKAPDKPTPQKGPSSSVSAHVHILHHTASYYIIVHTHKQHTFMCCIISSSISNMYLTAPSADTAINCLSCDLVCLVGTTTTATAASGATEPR